MPKTISAKETFLDIKQRFEDGTFRTEELEKFLRTKYDLDQVTFQNCHGSQLTFDQLVRVFVAKGKLEFENGKYKVSQDFKCRCSH